MLEIRPNCEYCDVDLPADSVDACICSYECTFCRNCVDTVLMNVCPNCGGGFVSRPIRPKVAYRDRTSLQFHPASTKRIHTSKSQSEIRELSQSLKHVKPENR